MPLVSVIVAIYNVEEYLEKCIDSILGQKYMDFELLLVDDGSPDHSPAICDAYAAKDARITVIHKQNGGVSSARNAGLEIAKGKYVCFIDGDDYITEEYLECMMSVAEEYHASVVVCGYYHKFVGKYQEQITCVTYKPEFQVLSTSEEVHKAYLSLDKATYASYPWNKLYSMELLVNSQIHFLDGLSIEEDFSFNIEVFDVASSVIVMNQCLYYYINIDKPTLTKIWNNDKLEFIEMRYKKSIKFHKKWNLYTDSEQSELANIHVRHILTYVNNVRQSDYDHKGKMKKIRELVDRDLSQYAAQHDRGKGLIFSLINYLILKRKVRILMATGGLIGFVKAKVPRIFAIIKKGG